LQRVVTDFGADAAFAQVIDKLVERYGVVLGESTIRRITDGHAQTIFETARLNASWPAQTGPDTVTAQMDEEMMPIVEPDAAQKYKRKGKQLQLRAYSMNTISHPFESHPRRPSPTAPPALNSGVRPPDPKCSWVDLSQARDWMQQLSSW
jgi:hypothetical protein